MRFSLRAFITAAAVGAGLLTAAGPAHAATGYDRCAWGKVCVFDGAHGTGAMTVITGDRATLGSWDNRITSIANYGDSAMCLYSAPNYESRESDQGLLYPGSISLDESPTPQLDNAISSVEFSANGSDCGTERNFPYWGAYVGPRPAGLPAAAQFGDLNGDGRRDMVAADTAGVLWFYPGKGNGLLGTRVRIGGGWNSMNSLVGIGDANGDGRSDLIARDTSRGLWLYPGNGKGWFGTRVKFSASWPSDQEIFATGDLDGDGINDFSRGFPGQMYYYSGTGKGTFGNPMADMPWDDASYVWAF